MGFNKKNTKLLKYPIRKLDKAGIKFKLNPDRDQGLHPVTSQNRPGSESLPRLSPDPAQGKVSVCYINNGTY